ncbi:MAG: peptidoglycan DD-metalloendopeptidase family protein, partial [Nanoarchaeota archaeon]
NGTGRQRFGNWVMIEHSPDPDTGQPRHTLYFHMNDTPLVTEGDNVTAGTLIGLTGRTGYQINTNHLHFELARDLDEDLYSQRRAVHPLHILNYSNINATNIFITANTTHYIVAITHNYTDMDFVGLKIVGNLANRTMNYETKEGINLSDADQKCYLRMCFEPGPTPSPFINYTNNYTIEREYTGPLIGAIIQDALGETQIYEITLWPNPTITLNKSALSIANTSDYITYNITLNITGDAAYNITLNETYPASMRYNSSSITPIAGTNASFNLGNISPNRVYRFNITMQVLNTSNGTIANNSVNVSYYNFTGTLQTVATSVITNITNVFGSISYNTTNVTISKADNTDPVNISTILNYTITLTSVGSGTAHNITLNETYPPEVRFVTATPTPIAGTNTSFLIPNLTAGSVYVVNISVLTLNTTGTINNTANVSFVNETGYRYNVSDNEQTVIENMVTAEPSPGGGGSTGGGGGGGSYVPPVVPGPLSVDCVEEFDCSDWKECLGGITTRTCIGINGCVGATKPTEAKTCTLPIVETPAPVQTETITTVTPPCTENCPTPTAPRIIRVTVVLGLFMAMAVLVINRRRKYLEQQFDLRNGPN